jgi:hypothetical protein
VPVHWREEGLDHLCSRLAATAKPVGFADQGPHKSSAKVRHGRTLLQSRADARVRSSVLIAQSSPSPCYYTWPARRRAATAHGQHRDAPVPSREPRAETRDIGIRPLSSRQGERLRGPDGADRGAPATFRRTGCKNGPALSRHPANRPRRMRLSPFARFSRRDRAIDVMLGPPTHRTSLPLTANGQGQRSRASNDLSKGCCDRNHSDCHKWYYLTSNQSQFCLL